MPRQEYYIEQANINMQKTGAIVDFFSPGALK